MNSTNIIRSKWVRKWFHRCSRMWWVHVLLRHSFAAATPKPIVIHGSRFLTICFGASAPKQKEEVEFHYSFWFPIEKQEVGIHYLFELPLPIRKAEVLFLRYSFWNFAPKTKGGTIGVELTFWNRDR